MGKAFRADALTTAPIANEIAALNNRVDIVAPTSVHCPITGCAVQYVLYNYAFSDVEENLASLMYGLRIHHPNHPLRFVLNEPSAQ